jgi:hypothetical protein
MHRRRGAERFPGTPTHDACGIAGKAQERAEVVHRAAIARK